MANDDREIFEMIWAAYPRRDDKARAWQKFQELPASVDRAALPQLAREFAQELISNRPDPAQRWPRRKIPHLVTWLGRQVLTPAAPVGQEVPAKPQTRRPRNDPTKPKRGTSLPPYTELCKCGKLKADPIPGEDPRPCFHCGELEPADAS